MVVLISFCSSQNQLSKIGVLIIMKSKRRTDLDGEALPKPKHTKIASRITLSTDFSGLETPRMALENIGCIVQQLFTCDSDENCRKMAAALYGDAERVFNDVQRKHDNQAPHVDVYVAGVCCQPWSVAGKKAGAPNLPHPLNSSPSHNSQTQQARSFNVFLSLHRSKFVSSSPLITVLSSDTLACSC